MKKPVYLMVCIVHHPKASSWLEMVTLGWLVEILPQLGELLLSSLLYMSLIQPCPLSYSTVYTLHWPEHLLSEHLFLLDFFSHHPSADSAFSIADPAWAKPPPITCRVQVLPCFSSGPVSSTGQLLQVTSQEMDLHLVSQFLSDFTLVKFIKICLYIAKCTNVCTIL